MTNPERERDEGDLKALFDATAETPDGMQLTKLRARAADVPALKRRPRWLVWAPFLAVAAGALAVVMLRGSPKEVETARGIASAPVTLVAPGPATVARAPAPPPSNAPLPSDETGPPTDENGAVADLSDPDDGFAMDDLSGPLDEANDEELDGWLAATDSFLEDG
jgi:hypothetical protein